MTYEDDVALSSWEWLEWLDSQPELDVPAGKRDPRLFIVLLADHTHTVEVKLWALLTRAGPDSSLTE
jgi:hypothetical protein